MRVRFEAEQAQQLKGLRQLRGGHATPIAGKRFFAGALYADLDFSAAQAPRIGQGLGADGVGPGFNDKPNASMCGVLVDALLFFQLFPGSSLLCAELTPACVQVVERMKGLVVRMLASHDCQLLISDERIQLIVVGGEARARVALS